MKFTWELRDIRGGCRVSKEGIKEKFIIGYHGTVGRSPCLISLQDGLIIEYASKEALVDSLNQGEYIPLWHNDENLIS